jgi:hypothetical protein
MLLSPKAAPLNSAGIDCGHEAAELESFRPPTVWQEKTSRDSSSIPE